MSYIVETVNLCKNFPVAKRYRDLFLHPFSHQETTAIEDVNISVKDGEVFGVLGPNGSGKTTLIKILSTLILPTKGTAFVDGLDVTTQESKIKQKIGYVVSDERSFFWRLTGNQNLRFFCSLNNISASKAETRIKELVTLMGLEDDINKVFQNYSSGSKQKLAFARGLLTNPEIIFLDEPTKSLDPIVAQSLRCFIKNVLVKQSGKTVLIATNNMQEAEEVCERIAIIHKGKIKQCGTIEEIRNSFVKHERFVLTLKMPIEKIMVQNVLLDFQSKVVNLKPAPITNNRVLLTVEVDMLKENISDIIEHLVRLGIKIESCVHEELPLSEVFSRCINA